MFQFYFRNEKELRKSLGFIPSNHGPVFVYHKGKELVVWTRANGEDYFFVSRGVDYDTIRGVVFDYFHQLQLNF